MNSFEELFLLLVIAHLVADFPLQNNWLVAYKNKSRLGILIHSAIVAGVAGAFLFPNIKNLWLMVIIIGISHFLIDNWKIEAERDRWLRPGRQMGYFLLDQLLHLVVLLSISWASVAYLQWRGINLVISQPLLASGELVLLGIVIWFVFGQAVLNQLIISVMLGEMRGPFFSNLERFGGMALRLMVLAISFYYLWVGLGLIVLVMVVLFFFKPSDSEPYKVQRLGGNVGKFAGRLCNDLYGQQRKLLGVVLNLLFGAIGGVLIYAIYPLMKM